MDFPASAVRSVSHTGVPGRVSIVIPNFNYGRFVGAAVDSALALDWPDIEVIVVDDGSTDDSRQVLSTYGERITVLAQQNAGPREACNAGFAVSSGDVVVFLDADDVLLPTMMRAVAGVWRPGVSKVQVQMQRIDAAGRPVPGVFPKYTSTGPTPDEVRTWLTETGAYPTPPGSGNIYARSFLELLFPLDDRCGDATDSACLAAAPYLGDVLTVPHPLVLYRIHEENRSKLSDPDRFTNQLERAYQRQRFAMQIAGRASDPRSVVASLRRGRHLVQMRIAERRLSDGPPPVPGDSSLRQLVDSVRCVFAPGPEPWSHRLLVLAWCAAAVASPPRLARRLINQRFG